MAIPNVIKTLALATAMQMTGWPVEVSHEPHCAYNLSGARDITLCDCDPVLVLKITEEETHEHL